MINKETETVFAVGAIISEIPFVDKVDVSKIKLGDRMQIEDGVSHNLLKLFNLIKS